MWSSSSSSAITRFPWQKRKNVVVVEVQVEEDLMQTIVLNLLNQHVSDLMCLPATLCVNLPLRIPQLGQAGTFYLIAWEEFMLPHQFSQWIS